MGPSVMGHVTVLRTHKDECKRINALNSLLFLLIVLFFFPFFIFIFCIYYYFFLQVPPPQLGEQHLKLEGKGVILCGPGPNKSVPQSKIERSTE